MASEREKVLERALLAVADFGPVDGLPKTAGAEWCWCGGEWPVVEHQPYCVAARAALALPVEERPDYCPKHQHYKWCECNGGMMGPTGYEAPPAQKEGE